MAVSRNGNNPSQRVVTRLSNEKRALFCLGNIGDEILPSYVGMIQRKHVRRFFSWPKLFFKTVKAVLIVIQTVKPNKTNDNSH